MYDRKMRFTEIDMRIYDQIGLSIPPSPRIITFPPFLLAVLKRHSLVRLCHSRSHVICCPIDTVQWCDKTRSTNKNKLFFF